MIFSQKEFSLKVTVVMSIRKIWRLLKLLNDSFNQNDDRIDKWDVLMLRFALQSVPFLE